MDALTFTANVDWSNPSWDLFIVLFFLIAAFLYGFSLGRSRIIVILVSIYMALAVVNAAPYFGPAATEINFNNVFVLRITSFIGIFVVLFFLLSRSALLKAIAPTDEGGSWWQVMLFSFLHVGLLISVTLSFLPGDAINQLALITKQIFVGDTPKFIWIVAPIVAMIVIRKRGVDEDD